MDVLIEGHLEEINELLTKIDDCLENGRAVPFSSRVSVDKAEIFEILADIIQVIETMRKKFPTEMRSAVRVVGDKDKIIEDAKEAKERIINDARSNADMILKAAEAEKNRILDEHAITAEARAYAREITETAQAEMMASKRSANEFFGEIFEDAEVMLRKMLEAHISNSREVEHKYNELLADIYDNRSHLQIEE